VFTGKPYPGLDPGYVRDELRDGQRELLERESRRLGFQFLNTYRDYMDYLNRYPNASFAVSKADGHPNALAHSIDAEAIFNYFVAHQLVPWPSGPNAIAPIRAGGQIGIPAGLGAPLATSEASRGASPITNQLATLPLGSASGGFTYEFEACPSRIRCQAATGSWTKSRQWET